VNPAVRCHHETMEQMMKENIVLTAGDGHVLPAYRITPDAVPRGQLVVLHEFFGLNDHIRNVADRFAALGYGAIVPGLSDRAEPGAEFGYDRPASPPDMPCAPGSRSQTACSTRRPGSISSSRSAR